MNFFPIRQSARHHRATGVLLLFLTVVLVLSGCWEGKKEVPREETAPPPSQTDKSTVPDMDSPAKEPQTQKGNGPDVEARIKLAAVGDVLIHSSVYNDAKTNEGYDFTPMFEPVRAFIEEADIAMANQETMIGGKELGLSDYPRFNSPHEVGDALKAIGFDVVTLANNHTLDRGEEAVLRALNYWDQIEMVYTGAFRSRDDQTKIRMLQKNGITLSFLAYTYGTNGIPVPEGKDYLVNLIEPEQIRQDISKASALSDAVIVSLHFGQEYQRMPNEEQKKLAREIIEHGALMVIGHHPHVLQPVEWIVRKDGSRGLAAYSLGNFISGQEGIYREIGGILQVEIVKKSGESGEGQLILKTPSFIPTWVFKKNWRNYKVYPLSGVDSKLLPHREKLWNEIGKHMTQWMPELQVK